MSQTRHRFKFKTEQYKCNSLADFKLVSKHISNLNGNTISNFLKSQPEIRHYVESIYNSNPWKYCSINKTFIALYNDLVFGCCKACGHELNYDQTWSNADFCSNKCKLNKYNNPFTRKDVQAKIRQTNLERYGVENPMYNPDIVQKVKDTTFDRYGTESVFQNEDIKEKIRQTNLERYGVEYSHQNAQVIEKFQDSRKITSYNKLNKMCKKLGYTLLCDFAHYNGTGEYYMFQCNTCKNIFRSRYDDGKIISRCFVCDPRKNPPIRSKKEIEVYDYVLSIYDGTVLPNDRIVIGPQEIDIYLPELNKGIEFDGTYWHSLKPDDYHELKDSAALSKNIRLIHIKEEDWDNNKEGIKQIIQEFLEQ